MQDFVVAVVTIVLLLTILILGRKIFNWYLHLREKLQIHMSIEAPSALSITGNLVKELKTPITKNYIVSDKVLGRGSSAEVVIGVHTVTQRRYAIKIIDISRKEIAWRYEREKSILKDVEHTNIVRLFEVYTSSVAQFFVMELCTGGHLGQVLKDKPEGRLDIETARQYIIQITRALDHCHSHGICHRDIKLQNILLESNNKDAQIKLVDFGNAARFRGICPMTKIVGTTYTAAPEVFKESYDERCDVWSLGVVAYILLSGRRPFEALHVPNDPKARESSIIASILMGRYHFMHEVWEDVNSAAIHLVQCCLEMDYTKRKTAANLLEHPWLAHADLHGNIGVSLSRDGAKTLSRRLGKNLSSTAMRRTSMIAVAFAMPNQKAVKLRKLFHEIDKNGNNSVDREEFHSAMQVVNPQMESSDIDILFDTVDIDGDHQISFIEFVAATIDPRELDINEFNQAFRLLDKEEKGYITCEDLRRVLATNSSEVMTDSETPRSSQVISLSRTNSFASDHAQHHSRAKAVQEERMRKLNEKILKTIEQSDINNDGVVSYTEFLFAMADGNLEVELQSRSEAERARELSLAKANRGQKETAGGVGGMEGAARNLAAASRGERTMLQRSRRQTESVLRVSDKDFKLKPKRGNSFAEKIDISQKKAPPGSFASFFQIVWSSFFESDVGEEVFDGNGVPVAQVGKGMHAVDRVEDSSESGSHSNSADGATHSKKSSAPPMLSKNNRALSSPASLWQQAKVGGLKGHPMTISSKARKESIAASMGTVQEESTVDIEQGLGQGHPQSKKRPEFGVHRGKDVMQKSGLQIPQDDGKSDDEKDGDKCDITPPPMQRPGLFRQNSIEFRRDSISGPAGIKPTNASASPLQPRDRSFSKGSVIVASDDDDDDFAYPSTGNFTTLKELSASGGPGPGKGIGRCGGAGMNEGWSRHRTSSDKEQGYYSDLSSEVLGPSIRIDNDDGSISAHMDTLTTKPPPIITTVPTLDIDIEQGAPGLVISDSPRGSWSQAAVEGGGGGQEINCKADVNSARGSADADDEGPSEWRSPARRGRQPLSPLASKPGAAPSPLTLPHTMASTSQRSVGSPGPAPAAPRPAPLVVPDAQGTPTALSVPASRPSPRAVTGAHAHASSPTSRSTGHSHSGVTSGPALGSGGCDPGFDVSSAQSESPRNNLGISPVASGGRPFSGRYGARFSTSAAHVLSITTSPVGDGLTAGTGAGAGAGAGTSLEANASTGAAPWKEVESMPSDLSSYSDSDKLGDLLSFLKETQGAGPWKKLGGGRTSSKSGSSSPKMGMGSKSKMAAIGEDDIVENVSLFSRKHGHLQGQGRSDGSMDSGHDGSMGGGILSSIGAMFSGGAQARGRTSSLDAMPLSPKAGGSQSQHRPQVSIPNERGAGAGCGGGGGADGEGVEVQRGGRCVLGDDKAAEIADRIASRITRSVPPSVNNININVTTGGGVSAKGSGTCSPAGGGAVDKSKLRRASIV